MSAVYQAKISLDLSILASPNKKHFMREGRNAWLNRPEKAFSKAFKEIWMK